MNCRIGLTLSHHKNTNFLRKFMNFPLTNWSQTCCHYSSLINAWMKMCGNLLNIHQNDKAWGGNLSLTFWPHLGSLKPYAKIHMITYEIHTCNKKMNESSNFHEQYYFEHNVEIQIQMWDFHSYNHYKNQFLLRQNFFKWPGNSSNEKSLIFLSQLNVYCLLSQQNKRKTDAQPFANMEIGKSILKLCFLLSFLSKTWEKDAF